jgi:hypothetical protein
MPYASEAQSRFIHALAAQGVKWAVKFVNDAHGTKVPKIDHVKKKLKPRGRGRIG